MDTSCWSLDESNLNFIGRRWPSCFLGWDLSNRGVEDGKEDLGGDSKLLM